MRRFPTAPAALVLLLSLAPAAAEVTRTLTLEATPGASPLTIENLVGGMSVVPGAGPKIVVTATVHAADDALASLLSLQMEDGGSVLRVKYPLDKHRHYAYPKKGHEAGSGSWFSSWFSGWGDSSSTKYDGRQVKVSGGGVLLYADVRVEVPRGAVQAAFRNLVGDLSGEGVEGGLKFDTASGDVTLDRVRGEIAADTGSGDVVARNMGGSFSGDTGSGDIAVNGFEGETIDCDTGSGNVDVRDASAKRIAADTGSGDISVRATAVEEFEGSTGSGDILLETAAAGLARVKADTGSGDVILKLSPDAGFDASTERGSGDVVSRFADAEPVKKGREIVGYRRGDARLKIEVDTGSGDITLEPVR